jgi:DNA-directed RNA polymerase specialized sigma24 family protein
MKRPDGGARLWNLLRDLHPRAGAVLLLRVGFQLPQRTVAAVMGVPQDSVGQLCEQALRALWARAGVACPDR